MQEATGVTVEVAFADQGYTGETAARDAKEAGVELDRGQATRGEPGVHPGAQTTGGRMLIRLAVEVPSSGTRSGTVAVHAGRLPRPGRVRSALQQPQVAFCTGYVAASENLLLLDKFSVVFFGIVAIFVKSSSENVYSNASSRISSAIQ